MADDIKRIVLQFTGESQDAKDDIGAILGLLAALDHVDVDAEAHVATAGANADIVELFAALKLLDDTNVEVDVDIQTDKLSIGTRLLRAFGIATGNADKGVEEFSSGISRLNINLPGMLGRLNAVSGAAFILALAIGVTLVGALGALVASIGAAIAGLAALGAAFAAALGPAVLLVIGVVQRLAAVWKVLKQEDEAELQAAQKRIEGNKAIASAMDRQAEAALQLKRANEDLGTATAEAYKEMEDAALRATDAILGLERARLGKEEAALGIKEANLELKKFIADMKLGKKEAAALFDKFTNVDFDPTKLNRELAKVKTPGVSGLDREEQELKLQRLILNVKDARLREKEATNAVTHAVVEKTRAEKLHLQFQREGINASPRYVAALRSVADAHRQVAKAAAGIADAKVQAANAKAQAMTEQLTEKEKLLLQVLKQVRDTFKHVFGPGIEAIITGIAVGLGLIGERIKPLRGAFTRLGNAMGLAVVTVIDRLTSPQNIAAFKKFTDAATAMIGPLTEIFTSLLQIILNIAQAALPLLLPLVQSVADTFNAWAANTGDIGALRDIIATLVLHFTTWWGVFKTFGAVFLEFFKIAAPFGLQLADALGRIAQNMLDWLKSDTGRQQVQEFLSVAVPFALRLARFLGQVILFLARIGEIAAPLLGPLLDLFGAILNINTRLLRVLARLSQVAGDVASFFVDQITHMISLLGKFVDKFIQLGIDWIGGLIKGIVKKAKDLLGAVGKIGKDVLDKIKHPWKIFSPSKVTEDYGENLVQGLINGIQGASKRLAMVAEVSLQAPILDPLEVAARSAPHAAAAAAKAVGGTGGRGDIFIEEQNVNLPTAVGGGNPDAKANTVQIATELRRSGRRGRR